MIRFGVLGPLLVHRDQEHREVTSAKQQALLGILLLRANRRVSLGDLVEGVWGDHPPDSADRLIRTYVWRLRQLVTRGGEPPRLPGHVGGYLIQVDASELDSHEFDQLLEQAHRRRDRGDLAGAADAAAAALSLWRGDVLAGVQLYGDFRADLDQLAERRESARDVWIDLELALGRQDRVVAQLTKLVAAGPVRERRVGQLITALYRAGRRTEALAAFDAARIRLVRESGLDPGPELSALHRAVLADELDLPSAPTGPGQPGGRGRGREPRQIGRAGIPRSAAGASFVGRTAELAEAVAAADAGGLVVVTGMPGIGKTSLALRVIDQSSHRFAGGHLLVDLHGYDERRRSPAEVLAGLVRRVSGSAEPPPVHEDELVAAYHAALAGRRYLLVLDNAADEAQVRPLLPPAGCTAIVTSRSTLAGLDATTRIALPALTDEQAAALLATMIGAERAAADRVGLAELVHHCAGLPLALAIAGARLATRADWKPGALAGRLRRESGRLSQLVAGDRTVDAAFAVSYRLLSADQATMFRRLGLIPGLTISTGAAAILVGEPEPVADRLLNALADANLVQPTVDPDRFQLHDLARLYAKDRASRDPASMPAQHQLITWYVATAEVAAGLITPGWTVIPTAHPHLSVEGHAFDDVQTATAWLDAERANLVAVACLAAPSEASPSSWRLADALRRYFYAHRHTQDWLATCQAGLAAARKHGDRHAEAAMLSGLGLLYATVDDAAAALEHYQQAATICQEVGWAAGEAVACGNAGNVYQRRGQLDAARECCLKALRINARIGSRRGVAVQLGSLAGIYRNLGRLDHAARCYTRCLRMHADAGNRHGEAMARCNLAGVLFDLDQVDEAADHLDAALELARVLDSPLLDALAGKGLAEVCRRQRRYRRGLELADRAVRAAEAIHDTTIEADARHVLALLRFDLGHFDASRTELRRALLIARRANDRINESQALLGLATIWSGRHGPTASRYAQHALRVARSCGHQAHISQAHQLLHARATGPTAASATNPIPGTQAVRHAAPGQRH